MKKLIVILALLSMISVGGCKTLPTAHADFDRYLDYAENFLYGAQLGLTLFGSYAPAAQLAINTGLSLVQLARKTADDYQAQFAFKAQIAGELGKLQTLGTQAAIGSPGHPMFVPEKPSTGFQPTVQ